MAAPPNKPERLDRITAALHLLWGNPIGARIVIHSSEFTVHPADIPGPLANGGLDRIRRLEQQIGRPVRS